MNKQPLHITNGDYLNKYLNELSIVGEKLIWKEMLCEGPAKETIYSKEHIELRHHFFNDFYNVELDLDQVDFVLNEQLAHTERYSEIVLWFEYDLFCHINMVAVISLLQQKKIDLPLYLVCSGRVPGSKTLKALTELNTEQLLDHYKNKIALNKSDIDIATTVWGIYCGKDHNLLKPFIVKNSSFKYLTNCLKAHLKRFPDSVNGLNTLEKNILEIIRDNTIKSKHHLLGYALNYQGYYGFGDMQLKRLIDKLSVFYTEENDAIVLNRTGHETLIGQYNSSHKIDSNMCFGGVNKYEYQFNKKLNKLVKTVTNVD
ncbi:DUF1835 domain-containing protein [Algibacter pectinivorans]|uniref:DUF1835 domain-containing protein n=1 Tax=Algibacter pectinivorans TaxID=870482 RepID=A0A1I1S0Z2_9FLAO|nr:DUF1835 domain-containing protein [Algibacter pectinivorans]SFD40206.1 hypothetical protein SAMN04487987_11278 [Algibacter pectinivorans]